MCHTSESRPCRAQEITDQIVKFQRGEITIHVLQWVCNLETRQINLIALFVYPNTPRDAVLKIVREHVMPLEKGVRR